MTLSISTILKEGGIIR